MAKPAPPDNPILNVAEAAIVLRVSDQTVRNLCNSGKLAHLRINYRQLIRRVDLLAYVESQVTGGTNKPRSPPHVTSQ